MLSLATHGEIGGQFVRCGKRSDGTCVVMMRIMGIWIRIIRCDRAFFKFQALPAAKVHGFRYRCGID